MVDLYHTRRTNFQKCAYYKRDERSSTGDMSKWVAQRTPTGYFYARKVNAQLKQSDVFVNVFQMARTNCTIETNDDIPNIEKDDVVSYRNTLWIVDSVQQVEHLKETQFSNGEHYTTIIGLRK